MKLTWKENKIKNVESNSHRKIKKYFKDLINLIIIALLLLGVVSTNKQKSVAKVIEVSKIFWEKDLNTTIGNITISEDGKTVQMIGNRTLPGKNAIYVLEDDCQKQEMQFDYDIDYGDSFVAAGLLMKVKKNEDTNTLTGYMLSFNNPTAASGLPGGLSDNATLKKWFEESESKLGGIWKFTYKLGNNTDHTIEKQLIKAINLPKSGTIKVVSDRSHIVLTGVNGTELNESIPFDSEDPTIGFGYGFFADHYDHGCDRIGKFDLKNFMLTLTNYLPHDLYIDPNGGTFKGNPNVTREVGIYEDTVDVPEPVRYGYDFVNWTKTGNGGEMTSLTDDATYTFGVEEVTDRITANWTPWTGTATVTKRDSVTEELLSGATFGLYEWNGTEYVRKSDVTDNGDGTYTTQKVEFTDQNQGKFRIVEETPPTYYTQNNEPVEFVINQSGDNSYTYEFEDEPNKTKVSITKIDSETKNRIEGAEFTVYEWDKDLGEYKEYVRNGEVVKLDFLETRKYLSSDWLYSNKKNEGKFRVVETGTPDGYYGNWNDVNSNLKVYNDILITEENNGKETVLSNEEGNYTNSRVTGTINLSKIDIETNKYLAQGDATLNGAVYGLYAGEDIYHKDTVKGLIYRENHLVETSTVINGRITFENVEIGKYYIKELVTPEGYTLDTNTYEVNVNYEGETVSHLVREVTAKEKVKKQAFQIQKLSTNSQREEDIPLEGAGFKIYLIKDLAGVKNGSIVPDGNGEYNIEDFKDYDFTDEQTALDYSTSEEGVRIPEIFTDEQGQVTSPELAYGQYIVIESTVPVDRYKVDPFVVEVRDDSRIPQRFRYIVDQEFEALVKVSKLDSKTKENVLNKDAAYRIWSITENKYIEQEVTYPQHMVYGTESNPYRITKEGYFITPLKMQIGEYELREVMAPEGYILQGNEKKIENGIITDTPNEAVRFKVSLNTAYYQDEETDELVIDVNQYNDPALGEVKITKQGEFLVGSTTQENGKIKFDYEYRGTEGAQFDIYAGEDIYTQDGQQTLMYEKDELVGRITTNVEGVGYLNNLPIGKYYIKEIKAQDGFVLNTEVKEFEIKYQGEKTAVQSIEIDYTNERQKINTNGENGLIIEKIADKKVYKPGEEVTYTIKVSNTSSNTITNISVKETKIDGEFEDIESDNIEKISATEVSINKLEPNEVVTLKFKVKIGEMENGEDKIVIGNLVKAKGTINVPDPDNPDKTIPKDVETEGEEDVVVTNKKLVIVKEALKESYEPGETIQYLIHVINNGTEDITDIEVNETMLEGRFVRIEESNTNGVIAKYYETEEGEIDYNRVIIEKINPGEEVILRYEYEVPADIELSKLPGEEVIIQNTAIVTGKIVKENPNDPDNPIVEEVKDEDREETEIKENNTELGIIKRDSKTGERVQGAVFGLYAEEDIKAPYGDVIIEKNTLIETSTTNNKGKAIFEADLPLGKYYIKEITAPKGYTLSEEKIVFDATYKGQEVDVIQESIVLNDKSTEVKVLKKDTEGNLLAGSELEIIDEEGNVFEKWTTTEEVHMVEKLEKGKKYTLRETNPSKGYTTANEIKFYIGADEKLYQIIDEETETEVEVDFLTMKDQKTKVRIEVKEKETGEIVPGIEVDIVDKETGEVVDTVVTTEEGADIEGLPVGDYELRIKDPENRGYVTDKTDIIVEDTLEEQKYEIEIDYTKVEIGLKDEETDNFLAGGKIEVKDKDGNVVEEIETEEDMSKLDRLPVGKYTLHQTQAPDGYWPSEDVEIEVRNTGEVQRFIIKNKRKIFDMSIEKKLVKQVYNGKETDITGELSKFEIRPQNIPGAEFWTIYTVTVRNVGEIAGKATVKEYVPDGFDMFQDSNLQWKVEGKEATLETEVLEPGESQEYEVVLRWRGHVLNIGMKSNKVEMISEENEFGFKDGNTKDNESVANVLVSLSTGLETYYENIIYIMLAIAIVGTLSIIIIEIHHNNINKRTKV